MLFSFWRCHYLLFNIKSIFVLIVKPEVTSLTPNPYRVLEEQTATLSCVVLDANPNTSIAWRWFRAESPHNVLYNGSTYTIPSIQRTMSGSYSCIASNSVGKSEAVSILVDVLCKCLLFKGVVIERSFKIFV